VVRTEDATYGCTDPLSAFDAVKAKSLLKGADPNRTKTKGLVYAYDPNNPLNVSTAQFLQAQWQENLGMDASPSTRRRRTTPS